MNSKKSLFIFPCFQFICSVKVFCSISPNYCKVRVIVIVKALLFLYIFAVPSTKTVHPGSLGRLGIEITMWKTYFIRTGFSLLTSCMYDQEVRNVLFYIHLFPEHYYYYIYPAVAMSVDDFSI